MVILGAIFIALVVHRILDQELFALAFMVLQVIAHWMMTLILFTAVDPGAFFFTYIFLMLLGEYVKMGFLALADNIDVKFLTKPILYGLSAFFCVCWVICIILQVVIWLTQY